MVGIVLSDMLRRLAQFTVVHHLAMVHTAINRASLHFVHYQRRVLTLPRQLRCLRVVLQGIRSSSSVRGGVVSSTGILVTLREITLGC